MMSPERMSITPPFSRNGTRLAENVEKPALQKADTAWKTAGQSAPVEPSRGVKATSSRSAPTASMTNVKSTTWRTRRRSLRCGATSVMTLVNVSCRSERRRPTDAMMRLVKATTPRPPSWMSSRIHACPQTVNTRAVSTTTRPVTHTALVAVKSASSHDRGACPGAYRPGRTLKPSVPAAMSARNEPANSCDADNCRHHDRIPTPWPAQRPWGVRRRAGSQENIGKRQGEAVVTRWRAGRSRRPAFRRGAPAGVA